MSSLSEQIRGYLLGGQPIKRENRKAGQTQYYYINPGQEYATASDLQTTDIPDEMMNPDGTMKTAGQLNNMQKYNQEVLNNANINPMSTLYNTGQQIGEFIADVQIAKNYKDQMDVTGKRLVNTFGSGQGSDIDNYYHPLLQCELSHISPQSQQNGIILGYAKEGWDYVKKTFAGQDHQSIINDSRKDLQNNLYGSNVGANNPNKSCKDLLDNLRTSNMRKLNIR